MKARHFARTAFFVKLFSPAARRGGRESQKKVEKLGEGVLYWLHEKICMGIIGVGMRSSGRVLAEAEQNRN